MFWVVNFVNKEQNRLPQFPHHPRQFTIDWVQSIPPINNEKDEIAFFHCSFGRCANVSGQLCLTRADNSARVPQLETFIIDLVLG